MSELNTTIRSLTQDTYIPQQSQEENQSQTALAQEGEVINIKFEEVKQ